MCCECDKYCNDPIKQTLSFYLTLIAVVFTAELYDFCKAAYINYSNNILMNNYITDNNLYPYLTAEIFYKSAEDFIVMTGIISIIFMLNAIANFFFFSIGQYLNCTKSKPEHYDGL